MKQTALFLLALLASPATSFSTNRFGRGHVVSFPTMRRQAIVPNLSLTNLAYSGMAAGLTLTVGNYPPASPLEVVKLASAAILMSELGPKGEGCPA